MSYVSKNPKFDSTILKDIGAGTPDNPAAGSDKIVNRSGALFLRDDTGTETELGSLPIDLTTDVTGVLPVTNGGTNTTSVTGTGAAVRATDPILVTPNIGTPSAGTLTNTTGLPIDGGTTGTLPLSRGGTGQTTATPAFDALAPTTTKGDIIASDGTNNVRQAVGADGLILKADSTTSTGLAWGSAAAGTGEVNYIENPDAEANTTGWGTYADAAGTTPVDGTGGTANITWTRQDSVVLRGNQSFKLTKDAADRQGEGVSYDFSIKGQDTSKKLKIQFDFKTDEDAAYAAGDLTVYIYDVTNSTLITPVDTDIISGQNIFQTSFNSTTSTSYRLIFHIADDSTDAWDAYIDNVIVGPGMTSQGAAIGPWESFTPTFLQDSGHAATIIAFKRRVGSSLEVNMVYNPTGPGTDGGNFEFVLPDGLNHTNEVINGGTFGGIMNLATDEWREGTLVQTPSQSTRLFLYTNDSAGTLSSVNGTEIGTSTNQFTSLRFQISVPIAEWAGKGIVPMLAEDNLSEFQVFTPVIPVATVTLTNNKSRWKRVGDSMELSFDFDIASSSSVGAAIDISIPGGFTANSDLVDTTVTGDAIDGAGTWHDDSAGLNISIGFKIESDRVRVNRTDKTSSLSIDDSSLGAGDRISGTVTIPITEFAGSQNSLVGYSQADGTNTGLLPSVTSMSDALATQLGYKQYTDSNVSGGTVTLSTNAAATVTWYRGIFIPYQTQDGTWRLKFTIRLNHGIDTSFNVTIAGVTFKNVSNYEQAVSTADIDGRSRAQPNTDDIAVLYGVASAFTGLSGDVELESKPTWAT